MAKDISVAPKERVNIKYVSDTGGAKQQVELPLRLAVLGDFTGREDDTALEDRNPVEVNKDNFNEVLAAHDLKMDLTVKDKLSEEEGGEMSVSIPIKHMKDFTPEAVAQSVPELKKLYDLRNALKSTKGFFSKKQFTKTLQSIVKDDAQRQKLMGELGIGEGGEGGE